MASFTGLTVADLPSFTPATAGDVARLTTDRKWFSYKNLPMIGMHMDGANNGSSFPDVTGNPNTNVGGVITSTAAPKFGTACGYFNGGSYLNLGTGTGLVMAGAYTIEGWFKVASVSIEVMLSHSAPGAVAYKYWGFWDASSFVLLSRDSTSNLIISGSTIPLNQWNHFAFASDGTTIRVFLNGVFFGSVVDNTVATTTALNAQWVIGSRSPSVDYSFIGFLDDFLVTDGVCKYTVDFAVPTAPFIYNPAPQWTQFDSWSVDGANIPGERGDSSSIFAQNYGRARVCSGWKSTHADSVVPTSSIVASGVTSAQSASGSSSKFFWGK